MIGSQIDPLDYEKQHSRVAPLSTLPSPSRSLRSFVSVSLLRLASLISLLRPHKSYRNATLPRHLRSRLESRRLALYVASLSPCLASSLHPALTRTCARIAGSGIMAGAFGAHALAPRLGEKTATWVSWLAPSLACCLNALTK